MAKQTKINYDQLRRGRLEAVQKGHCINLVPRQDVYAYILSGDARRFAELFYGTWKRLPLYARRRILKHWRSNNIAESAVILAPDIQLTAFPLDKDFEGEYDPEDPPLRGTWASVNRHGQAMAFYWPIINRMPDPLVHDLIAHELAHIHQFAEGWQTQIDDDDEGYAYKLHPNGNTMSMGECEDDADDLMEHWGFSATAMDQWALREGIAQVREVTLEEYIEAFNRFDATGMRS